PTGDKDPFALRRHAIGIIRIVVERNLEIKMSELLGVTIRGFTDVTRDVLLSLEAFIFERFAGMLREQGYTAQELDAVWALPGLYNFSLLDLSRRFAAVHDFSTLPEAPALAAANKRVGNILKKAEGGISTAFDINLLKDPAEQMLRSDLAIVMPKVRQRYDEGDYIASLRELAVLKAPVDAFFDNVMVNVEDEKLRANRLALLGELHEAMNQVADISRLAT
ncbi:MAG: glycine--tRNA ligase subunit beta, partial [Gallionellaceae bacterium]|nr:glycine--tRNA ligase subunit beta [Gallionellaceae bacterium]